MPEGKRRAYGRGGIHQTPDGRRYRARIMLKGKSHDQSFDSYAEAEEWLDDLLDGIERATDMRVGEWLEDWRERYARKCSAPTADFRKWAIGHLEPIASIKLRALRAEHVAALLADLATQGYSAGTLMRIRGVLSSACKCAVAQQRAPLNACDTVQIPECAKAKKARHGLTREERARVLAAARDTEYEALLGLGLYLGMRPGEICALAWSDIDLDVLRIARITRSRRMVKGQPIISTVKTEATRRTVRLPVGLVGILLRHRTAQKRAKRAASRWHKSSLVCTTSVGTPIDPNRVRRIVRKACEAAGVEPITPYEMRHTAISLLREANVEIGAVRRLVGHSDVRMLAPDYYEDPLPVAEAAIAWEAERSTNPERRAGRLSADLHAEADPPQRRTSTRLPPVRRDALAAPQDSCNRYSPSRSTHRGVGILLRSSASRTIPTSDATTLARLVAKERERMADDRKRMADQRERMADQRDRMADERKRMADQRDRMADERKRMADERETRHTNLLLETTQHLRTFADLAGTSATNYSLSADEAFDPEDAERSRRLAARAEEDRAWALDRLRRLEPWGGAGGIGGSEELRT